MALSGGRDSCALLHALAQWLPDRGRLRALHVNHGLQDAAQAFEAHCAAFCDSLGVPLEVRRPVVVRGAAGLEAAAREARYRAFSEVLGPDAVMVLAHHAADQAETLLLRLLRGSGADGMGAMPPSRALGRGLVLRPWLQVVAAQIEDYAAECGLPFVDDPSNHDLAFDRNYLRHEVMPRLRARWPGCETTLSRAASHARSAARALAAYEGALEPLRSATGDAGFRLASLLGDDDAVAGRRLARWLRTRGLQAPQSRPFGEWLRQLRCAGPDRSPRLVLGGRVLERYGDGIYLHELSPPAPPVARLPILPGETLALPASLGTLRIVGDDAASGPLAGARFAACFRGHPAVRSPLRRPLRRAFRALQIPPWWREHVPLVTLDDRLFSVAAEVLDPGLRHSFSVVWERPFD